MSRPLEHVVETEIRLALQREGLQCWKHRVEPCPYCGGRPKKGQGLGLGASDLVIIVPPTGRFLGIEVKRPGYSPSDVRPEQRAWLSVPPKFGAVAGVASSVDEAMRLVRLAREQP